MTVSVNGNKEPYTCHDSYQRNKNADKMYWQVNPANTFKPNCFHCLIDYSLTENEKLFAKCSHDLYFINHYYSFLTHATSDLDGLLPTLTN